MRRTWQRRRSSVTWSNKPRSTSAERFEAEIRKRSCTRDKRSVHTNGSALSEIFYYSAASYLSIKRKRERERVRERERERERENKKRKRIGWEICPTFGNALQRPTAAAGATLWMHMCTDGERARMEGEPRIEWPSIAVKSRASRGLLFRCPSDRWTTLARRETPR